MNNPKFEPASVRHTIALHNKPAIFLHMVKLNKIYTKNGDRGETQLVGGTPTKKSSARVQAYGEIDELNAALGIVRTHCEADERKIECYDVITIIQNQLFDIGSILATDPNQAWDGMPSIETSHISQLETWIDSFNKELPELSSFVLPGGTLVCAALHLARTICRRAERSVCHLMEQETVANNILVYINRLSDLLFVLARWDAKVEGKDEYLWVPGGKAQKS